MFVFVAILQGMSVNPGLHLAPDSGLALVIYLGLLGLIVNQMEWTRTPAAISKVSRWTFAIQAIADCYAFVAVSHIPSAVRHDILKILVAYYDWDDGK